MGAIINGVYQAVFSDVVAVDDVTAGDDVISGDDIFVGDDLIVAGKITLTGGDTIDTTANGNIVLLPNGTGIVQIGDASSTSHTLNTNDDLYVAGRIEADGIIYGDSNAEITGDITLGGNITMTAGGSIATTANGNLVLIPNGTGITVIGDAGSTSHSLAANDDLMITGKLEVDGITYLDNTTAISNTKALCFGSISGDWGVFVARSTELDLALNVGQSLGRAVVLTTDGLYAKNFDHGLQSTPTFYFHSDKDPDDSNQEYLGITHDTDDSSYTSGHGGHVFKVAAQSARGTVTFSGVPLADETMVINATTITFKADGSGDVDHCTIGGTAAECVTNLVTTLGECSESGNLTAWDGAGDTVVIEWGTAGTAGNSIVFTEAATNVAVDGSGTLGATHSGVAASTLLDLPSTGNFVVKPNSGITVIGDAGSTSHSLAANDDLFVSGVLEVDNSAHFDSGLITYAASTLASNVTFSGTAQFGGSTAANAFFIQRISDDGIHLGIGLTDGQTNGNIIICNNANITDDYDHSTASLDPSLIIHSRTAAASSTMQYTRYQHNTVDEVIDIGTGSRITQHITPIELADDASFDLVDASSGFGTLMAGDAAHFAIWYWKEDGTVTLVQNTADVENTDTGDGSGDICIFDNGTQVRVTNRTGAAIKVMFDLHYTTAMV